MINFNHYDGDAFELYKSAVKAKIDKVGKESLTRIEDDVKAEYEIYKGAFSLKQVHALLPSTNFTDYNRKLLLGLYGSQKKIVKDVRRWIDLHNKRTYLCKCPYCTISPAGTTEHFLPKEKYPEFAVNALNLLPCCSICNGKKGERVKTDDGKPYIINFYYNVLPNEQYLFVDISIDAMGYPNFVYRLDNKNGIDKEMFELIERHFEQLELLERFTTEAICCYSEIENSILENLEEKDDLDLCLRKMRNTALKDAVEYGSNHWKVVLKLALADNNIYREYLDNKLLKQ